MYQIWYCWILKAVGGRSVAAQIIHEQGLAGSIVFLTAYSDSSYIEGAKTSGVSGYCKIGWMKRHWFPVSNLPWQEAVR